MSRAARTAILYVICLTVVLAAMGWVSLTVLRLDRAEAQARQQAALEEDVRLALWRMDSALAPIIAQESARPYFAYSAFYPAERAYSRMFGEFQYGEVLVPSPLLNFTPPYTVIHFQLAADGTLTSPQVPEASVHRMAVEACSPADELGAAAVRLAALGPLLDWDRLVGLLPEPQVISAAANRARVYAPPLPDNQLDAQAPQKGQKGYTQAARSQREAQMRNEAVTNTAMQQQAQVQMVQTLNAPLPGSVEGEVAESTSRPIWCGSVLLLARRVEVGGRALVQGCQLDWPAIEAWLVAGVADLLPSASVQAAPRTAPGPGERMLAALPVLLAPGNAPGAASAEASPIRMSLIVAWICVLLAATAVGILLIGTESLSDRRATFVSAVTHELRTPLTTFRMYAEMLAEGMVPDEVTRRQYLMTLKTEAERLTHLVANVLAFARLERGRGKARFEVLSVGELVARVHERLAAHAAQAGMTLEVCEAGVPSPPVVGADPSAVEQILFNLVDNACKYAGQAPDRRIHLEACGNGEGGVIRVRDHGPGLSPSAAKRLFRPFSKSAHAAANSAPGIGLGLALSRRLARGMGGELSIDRSISDGACFALTLPAVMHDRNDEAEQAPISRAQRTVSDSEEHRKPPS